MVDVARYLWLENAYLPGGWKDGIRLGINAEGDIVSLRQEKHEAGDERIHGAVIPGMPNLHSHAFQRAFAGLTERRGSQGTDNFWTWREVLHHFVTGLTPDTHEAIARQLYVEMLKAGYTAVGEFHYLHLAPDGSRYADPAEMSFRLVAAAEHTGIGMTLLPVLYSVGGYRGAEINAGQRRYVMGTEQFLDLVQALQTSNRSNKQMRIGIAPHSVRQVPPEPLFEVLNGARDIDPAIPTHIHTAEQLIDVDEHVAATGARPVEWLLANAPVDERWCLIHATHIDASEITGMARAGATVGLCPTTEANLGDGIFPLESFLCEGGNWGIGSDSHVSVSPVEELRWLEYGRRLVTHSRNIAAPDLGGSTGARLFEQALQGGALALDRPIGSLEIGNRADLAVLDTNHPLLYGRDGNMLLDTWIFSGNEPMVRHVMVGGRWVVRDGSHANEKSIAEEYKKALSLSK